MANDFEERLGRLEMNFDAYMALFYRWLDEQRQDMKEMRKEHEERMREHEERMQKIEEQTVRLIDTQGMLVKILNAIDDKLDNHENRLSSAGL